MAIPSKGSWLYYFEIGARLSPWEWLLIYFLFPTVAFHWASGDLGQLFRMNAVFQLCLFVPLVQIPSFLTSRMAYVDIGWPCGLVLMAYSALVFGTGWWVRRYVICGMMLLHGGRMAIGAIVMFGMQTKFTYRFDEDLPRYKYARLRWEGNHGMPASKWWLKIQHDTLQQCFANATVLARVGLLFGLVLLLRTCYFKRIMYQPWLQPHSHHDPSFL
jgi:hypothetical protein